MGLVTKINEVYGGLAAYCDFVISKPTVREFYQNHDPETLWKIPTVLGFLKYAFSHPNKLFKTIHFENRIYHVNKQEYAKLSIPD